MTQRRNTTYLLSFHKKMLIPLVELNSVSFLKKSKYLNKQFIARRASGKQIQFSEQLTRRHGGC